MMDYTILETLENKINTAVQTLQLIYEENRKLKEEKQELLSQAHEKDIIIDRLKQECKEFRKAYQMTQHYAEKEVKIKERLEAMLSKLDELKLLK